MKKNSILVVDDNPEIFKVFNTRLHNDGWRIFTALNGKEALQVLDENPMDLIISDIRMPEMDGIELLRRVRDQLFRLAENSQLKL